MGLRKIASLAIASLIWASCGLIDELDDDKDKGGGKEPIPGEILARETIGPDGGELEIDAGTLAGTKLVIPAGAVEEPVDFTIATSSAISKSGFATQGPAVAFGPSGTQFLVPVTVSVPYTATSLPEGKGPADLVVLHKRQGAEAEPLPVERSSDSPATVSALTSSFSVFQAATEGEEPGEGGAVRITSFHARPATITKGGSSTLSWEVEGAEACELDGAAAASPTGSREVSPEETTSYTLRCTAGDEEDTANATVRVSSPGAGPTTPTAVLVGGPAKESVLGSMLPDGSGWFADLGEVSGADERVSKNTVVRVNAAGQIDRLISFDDYQGFEIVDLVAHPDGGAIVMAYAKNSPAYEIGGEIMEGFGTLLVRIASDGGLQAKFITNGYPKRPEYAYGRLATLDPSNNLYLTLPYGSFEITVGGEKFKRNDYVAQDSLLVKVTAELEVAWARSLGGPTAVCDTTIRSISTTADGVAIAGDYLHEIAIGDTTLTTSGEEGVFVAKYDASGNLAWAKGSGSGTSESTNCRPTGGTVTAQAVHLAKDGTVWLGAESAFDFALGDGTSLERSQGHHPDDPSKSDSLYVVIRYGLDGKPIGALRPTTINSSARLYFTGFAPRADGSALAFMRCQGGTEWVPGEPIWPTQNDSCVTDLGPDTTPRWGRRVGGVLPARSYPITTSSSDSAAFMSLFFNADAPIYYNSNMIEEEGKLGSGKGLWRIRFDL